MNIGEIMGTVVADAMEAGSDLTWEIENHQLHLILNSDDGEFQYVVPDVAKFVQDVNTEGEIDGSEVDTFWAILNDKYRVL